MDEAVERRGGMESAVELLVRGGEGGGGAWGRGVAAVPVLQDAVVVVPSSSSDGMEDWVCMGGYLDNQTTYVRFSRRRGCTGRAAGCPLLTRPSA